MSFIFLLFLLKELIFDLIFYTEKLIFKYLRLKLTHLPSLFYGRQSISLLFLQRSHLKTLPTNRNVLFQLSTACQIRQMAFQKHPTTCQVMLHACGFIRSYIITWEQFIHTPLYSGFPQFVYYVLSALEPIYF